MSSLPVILVTGANQGLGWHTCQQLAKSGGYRVLLGSRDPQKGADAVQKILSADASITAETLEAVQIDITSDSSIDTAVAHIESKYGYLDVLINNAAISAPSSPNATVREHYQEVFNVNVFSHAVVTEKMLPLLKAGRSATKRIVFTGSSVGSLVIGLDPEHPYYLTDYPVYRSSKTALNMLMVYYSQRLKADDVAVMALCPGHNATSLNHYTGTMSPDVGAKIIVKSATEGSNAELNARWFDAQGKLPF